MGERRSAPTWRRPTPHLIATRLCVSWPERTASFRLPTMRCSPERRRQSRKTRQPGDKKLRSREPAGRAGRRSSISARQSASPWVSWDGIRADRPVPRLRNLAHRWRCLPSTQVLGVCPVAGCLFGQKVDSPYDVLSLHRIAHHRPRLPRPGGAGDPLRRPARWSVRDQRSRVVRGVHPALRREIGLPTSEAILASALARRIAPTASSRFDRFGSRGRVPPSIIAGGRSPSQTGSTSRAATTWCTPIRLVTHSVSVGNAERPGLVAR